MALELDEQRRALLIADLKELFRDTFDMELSDFRANGILEFFLASLGPQVYNPAVQDARAFFQQKLDDLDGEVYEPEGL